MCTCTCSLTVYVRECAVYVFRGVVPGCLCVRRLMNRTLSNSTG